MKLPVTKNDCVQINCIYLFIIYLSNITFFLVIFTFYLAGILRMEQEKVVNVGNT